MNLLALDLATRTGWCLRENAALQSGVETFDVRRGESRGMRYLRFRRWLEEVGARVEDDDDADAVALLSFPSWIAAAPPPCRSR